MNVHFIAIGGAIMHQLALALQVKGYHITGSDDVIQEPSKSRLKSAGLLPIALGFDANNITKDIDVVILGMHAKFDNPELARAMELGIKVFSFPEYIYEQSKDKTRVVIAGSHGKTSITSMIMHCLNVNGFDFDYLVGSNVNGFERSVKVTDAPIIIIEGDEYLASPILKEPKFMFYKANFAILSGIEWDHINVFKTEEIYFDQFKKLVKSLDSNATLFYYNEPKIAQTIEGIRDDVKLIPYQSAEYSMVDEINTISYNGTTYSFEIFGKHNMENLEAAKNICMSLGVEENTFYKSMQTFSGAGRRLEKIVENADKIIYKDFAHSPSKLKATVKAVLEKHPNRPIVGCFELHTFSTLTPEFLPNYAHSLEGLYESIVFIDKSVIEKKGNTVFTETEIKNYFKQDNLLVFNDKDSLESYFNSNNLVQPVYLMMSSGTFGGLELSQIGITKKSTIAPPFPVQNIAVKDNTSVSTNENVFYIPSLYDTHHFTSMDKKEMMTMFSLSYVLGILSPLYFYFKSKKNKPTWYNIMSTCFNFQVLTSLILFTSHLLSSSLDSTLAGIVFWITAGVHIYYTYQAIQQLSANKPVDIPRGFMLVLPSIDKR